MDVVDTSIRRYYNIAMARDKRFADIANRAKTAHDLVNQYYDNTSYYEGHITRTVEILLNYINTDINIRGLVSSNPITDNLENRVLIFAMFFHDSIEDARLTYNDVKNIALGYFGDTTNAAEYAVRCAELVYALTNEKGRTRADRENDKYFEGIRDVQGASFLKACDRLANLSYSAETHSSMFKKYINEMPNFISKINVSELPAELLDDIDKIVSSEQN